MASYDFRAVINQACRSGVEAPDFGVQGLHPPAVLSVRLIHRNPDSFSNHLRNIQEKRETMSGFSSWESGKRRLVKLGSMSPKISGSGTKFKRSHSPGGGMASWKTPDRSWS